MYFLYLILLVALVFVVHSILPTYYNKIFNKDIVRTTGQANKIMLTFDDGPDDRYIHELLEVLDQNQVKASFFMVAEPRISLIKYTAFYSSIRGSKGK